MSTKPDYPNHISPFFQNVLWVLLVALAIAVIFIWARISNQPEPKEIARTQIRQRSLQLADSMLNAKLNHLATQTDTLYSNLSNRITKNQVTIELILEEMVSQRRK